MNPRAPSTVAVRSSGGGTSSIPEIRPLAIDGAAPSTTTNVMAFSVSPKSRIAKGNQAIDGMVCRPVSIEPIAERSTREAETAIPTVVPITSARVKPIRARTRVLPSACQNFGSPRKATNWPPTSPGEGRT